MGRRAVRAVHGPRPSPRRRARAGAAEIEEPEPFVAEAPTRLPVERFGSVIFASGFRPAYRDWLPWPDAFDDLGFPIHRDGASTVVPGLHFVGVHFLRKRKSSSLLGRRGGLRRRRAGDRRRVRRVRAVSRGMIG